MEAIKIWLLASLTGILMSNLNPSGAKDRAEAVTGKGFHICGQKRHEYGNEKVPKVLNTNFSKRTYYFFSIEKEFSKLANIKKGFFSPVWRIRDVYPGSRILIFTHLGSRISDPGSKNSNKREVKKNLLYFVLLSQRYKYCPYWKRRRCPGKMWMMCRYWQRGAVSAPGAGPPAH